MSSDQEIPCNVAGCEEVRIWTSGEQDFFQKQGYEAPKYCKPHAAERRKQRADREAKKNQMTDPERYGY